MLEHGTKLLRRQIALPVRVTIGERKEEEKKKKKKISIIMCLSNK
jgi:hypothetical protein